MAKCDIGSGLEHEAPDLQESTAKDPTVVPTIDTKNWSKTMELMENYIQGLLGVDNTPFSYPICVDMFPPRAADDPAFGAVDSVYHSTDDEIIGRHRIVNQSAAAVGVSVEVH